VASEARHQLIDLQRTLYEKAFRDAHALASGTSRSLLAYSQRFERSLPDRFTKVDLKDLTKQAISSDIVLYGDFHTLRQSQRGLIRVLRAMYERPTKGRTITIAMEAFRARDQKLIDGYLDGSLDEVEFLRRTEYHKSWGFPWSNFRMLFEFAREHRLRVIGINSDRTGRDSLRSRDDFAATILTTHLYENPEDIVFCLIGEHHLADQHLPRSIVRAAAKRHEKVKVMRIMSNIDRYFFDLPHDKPLITTEYLKLRPDVFCVINSPPWMKWQSYIMWEELRGIADYVDSPDGDEGDSEFDQYTEQTYDIDYHFLSISKSLVDFLRIKMKSGDLTKFSIYSNLYSEETDKFSSNSPEKQSNMDRILERANVDGVYFVSDSNIVLLNHLSLNNLSEAAGQFVHRVITDFSDENGTDVEKFFRRIIKFAVGMAASKMLNPKRQCLHFEHFSEYLEQNRHRRLPLQQQGKRECFRNCLKFRIWMHDHIANGSKSYGRFPKSIIKSDLDLSFEVSRALGLTLGYQLYAGVMSNTMPGSWIRDLFLARADSGSSAHQILSELFGRVIARSK
jgi:uncharacterized iron-regulated protein